MRRSGTRFLPLLLSVIILIIIIVAIVSIGRALFMGTTQPNPGSDEDVGRSTLLDTSANHSVELTVRGPIVAQENFSSYQIQVSPASRSMTVYKGYLDDVQNSKNFDNNQKAYEQFVYALDKANMMKGTVPSDDAQNDLRGICATGYVYQYSVKVDGQTVKRLWTSTCGGSKGTLDASVDQLNGLFQAQVPGSGELIPFKTSVPSLPQL